MLLPTKRRAYFCKGIATEMGGGGLLRDFWTVSLSGVGLTPIVSRIILKSASVLVQIQEKASAEIRGEFFRTNSRVNFAVDFCRGFFRAFFLGKKTGGRNPPQNPRQCSNQSLEFRGQNAHCKDPALSSNGKLCQAGRGRASLVCSWPLSPSGTWSLRPPSLKLERLVSCSSWCWKGVV